MGTYRKLVEMHERKELSFEFIKTFNMDEYVGEWEGVSGERGRGEWGKGEGRVGEGGVSEGKEWVKRGKG